MSDPGDEDGVERLPPGWTAGTPGADDAAELTELLRRQQQHGRGWPGAAVEDVRMEVSGPGNRTRQHVALRSPDGRIQAWGSTHDRAAGRLVLAVVVDPLLEEAEADLAAGELFDWGERVARRTGVRRGLRVQQIDSGSFEGDERQQRWLVGAGFERVRTWWQMTRPVSAEEVRLDPRPGDGVVIRQVRRDGDGMPDERDLRTVHDVLETAFVDHFNSHEETFDEFVSRLRADPGHRWDHWWVAEVARDGDVLPAGALVASVVRGEPGEPDGSYVDYIGVLEDARGRGVARSLLLTAIHDAAARGRDRVDLEVDAESPTGATHLYTRMGWTTKYVTVSWHRSVAVER